QELILSCGRSSFFRTYCNDPVWYLDTAKSGASISLSLTLGLIWAALGVLYLTWLTRRFRKPPPQFEAAKIEQAWDS
ncbi:hypothetical protein, partial [Enterobacter cloacae]|uniref:hypothetical protein n=1 Tax=Enterobacter cloacae TaxID=550 RepID=UPI002003DD10